MRASSERQTHTIKLRPESWSDGEWFAITPRIKGTVAALEHRNCDEPREHHNTCYKMSENEVEIATGKK